MDVKSTDEDKLGSWSLQPGICMAAKRLKSRKETETQITFASSALFCGHLLCSVCGERSRLLYCFGEGQTREGRCEHHHYSSHDDAKRRIHNARRTVQAPPRQQELGMRSPIPGFRPTSFPEPACGEHAEPVETAEGLSSARFQKLPPFDAWIDTFAAFASFASHHSVPC